MRTSLVLGFTTVLLLTAAGIVGNGLYTSRKIVRNLAHSLLEKTTDLAELKMEAVFGVVAAVNRGTAVRLQNGLLPWQDWDSFRRLVLPMLQQIPQVSAVGAGDDAGNAYNLVRFGTHWRSQETRPAEWGTRTQWKEWTPDGLLVREWWEESDFDPRQRPWFVGAVNKARTQSGAEVGEPALPNPHWTAPYQFFTTGESGVSVSSRIPWTQPLEAVVYFDVALSEVDEFVFENPPSPHGFLMVLNQNLQVVGWPGREELSRGKVLGGESGVELVSSRLPYLAKTLQTWKDQGQPNQLVELTRLRDENFWFGTRSLSVLGTVFHVLTVIPEDDILGEARQERQRMIVVFALGLLGAAGLAFWLAALYTRPIALLVERSEAIQRLDLSVQSDISSHIREVQRLSSAQASMSSALESFSRYVPREVIAELLRQGEAARIGAHPAELTVLFTDIRRFTAITETLAPDEVARSLSDYFNALHGILERHQGTTDKFIGDAIMAFWGAPRPDEKHALHAVRAVLAARGRLDALNRQWVAGGRPQFQTTFGLATGPVVVGNVGADTRLNYTVLGNTVNVASRCVGLGRELGCSILALESVMAATTAEIEWRRIGPVQVRGISRPVLVCEPLGVKGRVPENQLRFKQRYEAALDSYLAKDIAGALRLLSELAEAQAGERSVQHLLQRFQELRSQPAWGFETELLLLG